MRRHLPFVQACLALCLGLGRPGAARADERELRVTLQPSYGLVQDAVAGQDRRLSGGGGLVQLQYGLTDNLSIQLLGGATAQVGEGPLLFWQGFAGVVYALDVVRVVPFFEAAVGAVGLRGEEPAAHLALLVGVGADYLVTRTWAVGFGFRALTSLSDPSRLPFAMTVGPRVVVRWEL